jgi:ribokinase
MRPARIRVVGYLSLDTLQAEGAASEPAPGGAALYAALGARHAGATVSLEALVGDDYPQPWLEALEALGIDVSRVQRRAGPSRRANLRYDGKGRRSSAHFGDALWWERTRMLAPVVGDDLAQMDAVVACPMPLGSLSALLQQAAAVGVPVVADTSEAFVSDNPQRLLQLAGQVAVFAPSREETRLMLPQYDDDAAAAFLARHGAHILHKRGAQGAVAVTAHGAQTVRIPAPPAVVIDPTGAGDATVGALAARWASGVGFLDAATAALATGALATTCLGPAALGLVNLPLAHLQ